MIETPHRILFVDDSAGVLEGIGRMLHGSTGRYELHFATSGEDALRLISARRMDVVVTDLQMPGMCGDELIEKARGLMPDGRFLLLCGDRRAPQAMALGRQGIPVLEKPCAARSLTIALEVEIRQMEMSANPGRAMR